MSVTTDVEFQMILCQNWVGLIDLDQFINHQLKNKKGTQKHTKKTHTHTHTMQSYKRKISFHTHKIIQKKRVKKELKFKFINMYCSVLFA